jgi:hypothetical protein
MIRGLLASLLRRPSPAAAARVRAATCAMQERFDEAMPLLQESLVREPWNAQALNLLGVCHSLRHEQAAAVRCYDAAIEADPALADAYLNAGWALSLLGHGDAKRRFHQWLEIVLEREPGVRPAPAATRRRAAGVTLCCIDCAYYDLAARALRASLEQCDFDRAIFLSDRDVGVPGVEFVPIDPIRSSAQYSNFVVHRLHEYVDTAHVLVIQYDGFVLDGEAWDDRFCGYDYVGGAMRVGEGFVVGNGGFSLRSQRLLRALAADPDVRAYDAARGPTLEDVAICASFRGILESRHGIRFAPVEVADRFSAEHFSPAAGCFGFHNLIHLVRLHENGYALPARPSQDVEIVFRARTELGDIAAKRALELRARADVWSPQAA